jgi:glycosyltransferase involved in cell wall biosynthesis
VTNVAEAAELLVIVPCFNEAASIAGVIQDIRTHAEFADILVVDDGSSDTTSLEAAKWARCIRLPVNLGIGGAVQTGIRFADRSGYGACVQVDGDGQHPADQIAKLVTVMRSKQAQIVVGSRYLDDNDGFKSSFMRRLGSRVISKTLGVCFGPCKITDPTSGFRMMDRRAIEFFSRHYPADFPEPISIAWALANGLEVAETPVTMRRRQAGASSIRMFKTWSYMIRVVVYIVLARMTPLSETA